MGLAGVVGLALATWLARGGIAADEIGWGTTGGKARLGMALEKLEGGGLLKLDWGRGNCVCGVTDAVWGDRVGAVDDNWGGKVAGPLLEATAGAEGLELLAVIGIGLTPNRSEYRASKSGVGLFPISTEIKVRPA